MLDARPTRAKNCPSAEDLELMENEKAYKRLTSKERQEMAKSSVAHEAEQKQIMDKVMETFWLQTPEALCTSTTHRSGQACATLRTAATATTAVVVQPQPNSSFAQSVVVTKQGSSCKKRSRKNLSAAGELGVVDVAHASAELAASGVTALSSAVLEGENSVYGLALSGGIGPPAVVLDTTKIPSDASMPAAALSFKQALENTTAQKFSKTLGKQPSEHSTTRLPLKEKKRVKVAATVISDGGSSAKDIPEKKKQRPRGVSGQLLPLLSSTTDVAAGGEADIAAQTKRVPNKVQAKQLPVVSITTSATARGDALVAPQTTQTSNQHTHSRALSFFLKQQAVALAPNTTQNVASMVPPDHAITHDKNDGKQSLGPDLAVPVADTLQSNCVAAKNTKQKARFERRQQAEAAFEARKKQIMQLRQTVPDLRKGFFTGTRTANSETHFISLALEFKAFQDPIYASTISDSWVFVVERNSDSIYANSFMLNFESIQPLHAIIHGNPRTGIWLIAPGTNDPKNVVKVDNVVVVFGNPVQMHENAVVVLGEIVMTFTIVSQ